MDVAVVPVAVDASPEGVAPLVNALRVALDGGPPVLPHLICGATPTTTAPEGTAVVIATSGSTGEPKLVALSAAALRASARATEARLGGPARWLLALPAEHVAGVQVIVRALLAGAAPHVLDLRSGFRAADFVAATVALGPGRRCTSLVPTQLRRLLDDDAGRAALRTYAAVLVGGAALEPSTRQQARDAGVRVVTTYGMSETAGGCVYDGVPLDGVVVDLEPDGRIRLGGPTLFSGYLGRPDETAAVLSDGRFRTSDLGRWRGGRLEVLGRADDVIVTGGEKVAPTAVERVLTAQPEVRDACVVGVPDAEWGQVVAAAVVWADEDVKGAGGDEADGHLPPGSAVHLDGPGGHSVGGRVGRLRDAVREELGRAAVPRRILGVAELPLRGVGKPDRAAVARLIVDR